MSAYYALLEQQEGPWRPIVFEDNPFPPTLMGVSILGGILDVDDFEMSDWCFSIRSCNPVPLPDCYKYSLQFYALMIERREDALKGISERLGPYRFEPHITYRDWLTSFARIAKLSKGRTGLCSIYPISYPQDYVLGEEMERRIKLFLEQFKNES